MAHTTYRVIVITHDRRTIIRRFGTRDRGYLSWQGARDLAEQEPTVIAEVIFQELGDRGSVRDVLGWYNAAQLDLYPTPCGKRPS